MIHTIIEFVLIQLGHRFKSDMPQHLFFSRRLLTNPYLHARFVLTLFS